MQVEVEDGSMNALSGRRHERGYVLRYSLGHGAQGIAVRELVDEREQGEDEEQKQDG